MDGPEIDQKEHATPPRLPGRLHLAHDHLHFPVDSDVGWTELECPARSRANGFQMGMEDVVCESESLSVTQQRWNRGSGNAHAYHALQWLLVGFLLHLVDLRFAVSKLEAVADERLVLLHRR